MDARLTDFPDLPKDALIWDVGGYEGAWSLDMMAKGYRTVMFEPVKQFRHNLFGNGLLALPFGLSDKDCTEVITVAGDRSSTYEMGHSGHKEAIQLMDVASVVGVQRIAVMKLNVEGAEYPILDRLIATDKLKQVTTYLIQFHTFIPNFGERYLTIRTGLLKTHTLTWRTPFVWERWDIK